MNWPSDDDGNVIRSLLESGFDFEKPTVIDFNIDFDTWPPDRGAIDAIHAALPNARLSIEREHGYLLLQVREILSYDLVVRIQAELSEATARFGGKCESWGVLHSPRRA